MNIFSRLPRPAAILLTGLVAVQAAHAASDPRKVVCAQACTLQLRAAEGFIDIKVPTASGNLKTLYGPGDRFELQAGQEYVLFLNESIKGWFKFDLTFTPKDGGPAWSCRVQTIADAPFIKVDQAAWSGPERKVVVNFDRTKTFLALDWGS